MPFLCFYLFLLLASISAHERLTSSKLANSYRLCNSIHRVQAKPHHSKQTRSKELAQGRPRHVLGASPSATEIGPDLLRISDSHG